MEHRLRTSHLVALAGAAATVASLWLPWYRISFGGAAREALDSQTQQLPSGFGDFARGLVAMLPDHIDADGWQALRGADVALLLGAILVAGLVLAAGGAFGAGVRVDALVAGRVIAALGVAGAAIALQHVLDPPVPSQFVSARPGIWLALVGSIVGAVGGWGMATPQREPEPAPSYGVPLATPITEGAPLEPAGRSVGPPPRV